MKFGEPKGNTGDQTWVDCMQGVPYPLFCLSSPNAKDVLEFISVFIKEATKAVYVLLQEVVSSGYVLGKKLKGNDDMSVKEMSCWACIQKERLVNSGFSLSKGVCCFLVFERSHLLL